MQQQQLEKANCYGEDHICAELLALCLQEERSYRCTDAYYYGRELSEPDTDLIHHEDSTSSQPSNNNIVKVCSFSSISDVRDVSLDDAEYHQRHEERCFWRQQMFEWSLTVLDSFGMDREAAAVAFNLLDRYISFECRKGGPAITRDDYQLYSMVCLYIAVKINEPYPRKLSVRSLVDMSKEFYSEDVIESTERDILDALHWRVATPTALSYVRLFLEELSVPTCEPSRRKNAIHHLQATATTLAELAVGDAFFVSYPNSCVGLAALLHAARLEPSSSKDRFVRELVVRAQSVVDTETSEFRAVYAQLEKVWSSHHHG